MKSPKQDSTDVMADLADRLLAIPRLEEGPSTFGNKDIAYFVGGKQVAHFHGSRSIDIRLTKEIIKEVSSELAKVKVIPRKSASDWVEIALTSKAENDLIIELIQRAAKQVHR
jgi:hypothetical protein